MHALVLPEVNQPLEWQTDHPDPVPEKGEDIVHIRAAALNSRDVWISKGKYAGIQLPCIPGSDGAGICNDKEVIINPSMKWGASSRFQGPEFEILGMPGNGTFAQMVAVPKTSIYPKPKHLSFEQAAALPLAALTAWRTLASRCQLRENEKVLITGIGGGVALMAMQIALSVGAEVWVTSSSNQKLDKAVELGAKGGANYKDPEWARQLKQKASGFDVIVDSGGGDGFAELPGICNPGARIGIYGGTAGKINGLLPQIIFWKQISVLGSTMGSPNEFEQMLRFVNENKVVPIIDEVFPMHEGQKAFDRMSQSKQFGKIVLKA